jgi:hypothetical protein
MMYEYIFIFVNDVQFVLFLGTILPMLRRRIPCFLLTVATYKLCIPGEFSHTMMQNNCDLFIYIKSFRWSVIAESGVEHNKSNQIKSNQIIGH